MSHGAAGSGSGSAFIGQPPNNDRDANIIRGWYRSYGLNDANVSAGFTLSIQQPLNYVHETKQPTIIAGMVISIMTIIGVTGARLLIRLGNNRTQFGLDDWAILIAASFAVVYPILQIDTVINAGAGKHSWEVTYEGYALYFYNLGICQLLFYMTVGMIKVSIALFIRRLAEQASKAWRIFCDVFLATLALYIGLALFWWVYVCRPMRARWDKEYAGSLAEPANCSGSIFQARVLSILHLTQGITLLSAPIIILWHVRISLAKKSRLFMVWIVGGLTITGGLLQQTATTITNDALWQYTSILRWTTMDITLGIVVASLPILDGAIMRAVSGTTSTTSQDTHVRMTQPWTNLEAQHSATLSQTAPKRHTVPIEERMIIDQERGGIEMKTIRTGGVY